MVTGPAPAFDAPNVSLYLPYQPRVQQSSSHHPATALAALWLRPMARGGCKQLV